MHGRGAAHRAAPWRECGRDCPRGENKRADSCRSQSCPAAALDLGADPLPVRVLELLARAAVVVRLLRGKHMPTAAALVTYGQGGLSDDVNDSRSSEDDTPELRSPVDTVWHVPR